MDYNNLHLTCSAELNQPLIVSPQLTQVHYNYALFNLQQGNSRSVNSWHAHAVPQLLITIIS